MSASESLHDRAGCALPLRYGRHDRKVGAARHAVPAGKYLGVRGSTGFSIHQETPGLVCQPKLVKQLWLSILPRGVNRHVHW